MHDPQNKHANLPSMLFNLRLYGRIGIGDILVLLLLCADFFLRQFCDAHKCKKGVKPFARGNGVSSWLL